MDRKARLMIIPRPFPPPPIAFVDHAEPRAPRAPRVRRSRAFRRWSARFYLAPWRSLACAALLSAALFALALLGWRAIN